MSALRESLYNVSQQSVLDKSQSVPIPRPSCDRWGFGVAVADYDNDGWPEIYVSNYCKNRLYHNNIGTAPS